MAGELGVAATIAGCGWSCHGSCGFHLLFLGLGEGSSFVWNIVNSVFLGVSFAVLFLFGAAFHRLAKGDGFGPIRKSLVTMKRIGDVLPFLYIVCHLFMQ